jgi:hypothetical protein
MTAAALLADLKRRGVRLTTADGRLRYVAPRGILTAEDRAALARNKAALVALLNPPAPSSWDSLAAQRWGPGLTDSTPGIDIDPDPIGRAERLARIYAEAKGITVEVPEDIGRRMLRRAKWEYLRALVHRDDARRRLRAGFRTRWARAQLRDALDAVAWHREAYARARADFEARHPEMTTQAA